MADETELTRERLTTHLYVALKTIRPPLRHGGKKPLPDESDRECRRVAEHLADSLLRPGVRILVVEGEWGGAGGLLRGMDEGRY